MGEEFAMAIKEYLSTKEGVNGDSNEEQTKTGSIGVISANPEQSKHLETATMKIYGQEIDFVNLRSEEYTDTTSRIPTIQFGTPEEDAFRRDFTVNSLFYNIMTSSIEDFTSVGLQDLHAGLIRTPLPAITTFRDDPLRLLRAVRFASRYDFSLDEDIISVGQLPEIHDALQHKISKERIFKELSGCFSGKLARPLSAINMIHQMNLFPFIFAPPSRDQLLKQHACVDIRAANVRACQEAWLERGPCREELSVDSVMEGWEVG
jgi:tRNA nucleotidyltransferase (CCA-adding enzyme)